MSWVGFTLFWFVASWIYVFYVALDFWNHRWPLSSEFQKPLKNHWSQWSDSQKTFNGDGSTMAKPLKNHWCQWCPEKNINNSIALKKWPSPRSNWSVCIHLLTTLTNFICFIHLASIAILLTENVLIIGVFVNIYRQFICLCERLSPFVPYPASKIPQQT